MSVTRTQTDTQTQIQTRTHRHTPQHLSPSDHGTSLNLHFFFSFSFFFFKNPAPRWELPEGESPPQRAPVVSVPKKEQETGDPNELKRTARTTTNAVVGATRPALIVPAGGAACLGAARRPPKFNKIRGSEEPDGSPLDYPLQRQPLLTKGRGRVSPWT